MFQPRATPKGKVSLGLRIKLSLIAIVVMAAVMIPFAGFTLQQLEASALKEATEHSKTANTVLVDMIGSQQEGLRRTLRRMSQVFAQHYPGTFSLDERHLVTVGSAQGPTLLLNGKALSLDNRVVDEVAEHSGGSFATVFVRAGDDFLRVVSSLPKEDGSRAVGTFLGKDHPAYRQAIRGVTFQGVVRLFGRQYLTEYVPIRDPAGQVIALFFVGVDLSDSIDALLATARRLKIGERGYVFIVDANPGENYGRFVLHPSRTGKRSLEENAAPIQEMLARREGVLYYDWRNPAQEEAAPLRKLAAYAEFRDLGWIISTSGYVDDFLAPSRAVRKHLISGMLLASVLAVLALNLAIGRWVVQPMFRMQRRIEHTAGMLRGLVQSIPDPIWFKDVAGRFQACNRRFEGLVGAPEEQIIGKTDYDLVPRELADSFRARDQRAIESRSPDVTEEWVTFADSGEKRLLETVKTSVENAQGEIIGVLGIGRDITERKRAEERTRQAATVFENARESIVIADLTGCILAVNQAFIDITGYGEAEVLGRNPRLLQSGRHGCDFYQALWRALATAGQWQGEIWNRRKNGEIYPAWMSICTVRNEQGNPTHYVAVATDISQLKRSEAQLLHLTHYDPLTDLPNRLLLQSRLEHALDRAQRHGRRVAVLLIDIDHFKTINDSLGHVAGDQLLIEVARRLGRRVREEDTLGRFGGDEFVLILDSISDPQAATSVARDLLSLLSAPFQLSGGSEVYVGASIGISVYPEDGDGPTDLIRGADAAMYQAKEAGRNGFCFYTADMNAKVTAQLGLEMALRRALERDEFVLHYQPKVDLRTGQVYGVEALIRWQPEGQDLVYPGSFIPQAERGGLIEPIGNWVIDTACRQIRAWREAGLRELRIAVNVSARQFRAGSLAEVVQAALARHQIPASSLELELTESALMEDPESAVGMLAGLKRLGVQLSLDDFGTGYSSFAYLSRFPIDALKIDQCFVHGIATEPQAAMIAVSIIDLAHRLHLKVVAEGVETEAQLGYLRMRDCDEMQGFYFARPMPPEELAALLQAGKSLPPRSASETTGARTLLIVDDEPSILRSLQRLLRQEGFRILTAESGSLALELLATHDVQVIVSDQRMPHMTGTDFLGHVKELYPDTVRMVLSGYTDLESVTQAVNAGAIYKFLHKPWDDTHLREEIRDAFRYYETVVQPRKACSDST